MGVLIFLAGMATAWAISYGFWWLRDPRYRFERERRKVDKAFPGWSALVQTEAFSKWVSEQPPEVAQLSKSERSKDAIKMLRLYTNSRT
jgi:hypothetical protein